MNPLRKQLSQKLRKLGVEERAWPGRDDGFASLSFGGNEFAHFHNDHEIDIRLGKDLIRRERLVHHAESTVHPKRSKNSPWFEKRIQTKADVEETLRLITLALKELSPSGAS